MNKSLDLFDIQLLNLLQENSLLTAEELAAFVPLSASAIARRVRLLRSRKVIASDCALLSAQFVDRRLQAIIHVALHEHAQDRGLASLRDRLAHSEEVQSCYEVTGQYDLLLITVTRDMVHFNEFADRLISGDPLVRRYETSFLKKTVKRTMKVHLSDDDLRNSPQ